jgi:hypothetical protein
VKKSGWYACIHEYEVLSQVRMTMALQYEHDISFEYSFREADYSSLYDVVDRPMKGGSSLSLSCAPVRP